jgi:Formate hydrogenlyase subunit 6/NADH:ubiquinone oxidoreductase 23 kD subunit (chain I)
MGLSLIWYLREFARREWIKKFLFAKTAPLVTPSHFRGFPEPTGKTCQHALFCMMVCPAPGAIEVLHDGDRWMPRIHKGHCIRCGTLRGSVPERGAEKREDPRDYGT